MFSKWFNVAPTELTASFAPGTKVWKIPEYFIPQTCHPDAGGISGEIVDYVWVASALSGNWNICIRPNQKNGSVPLLPFFCKPLGCYILPSMLRIVGLTINWEGIAKQFWCISFATISQSVSCSFCFIIWWLKFLRPQLIPFRVCMMLPAKQEIIPHWQFRKIRQTFWMVWLG